MTRQATVGRLFGVPIRIDATWLLIAGLVLVSLSAFAYPFFFVGYERAVYWTMGAAATAGLFASILVHELAHAVVARRLGTPVECITLFLLGGVVEMGEEPPSPRAELYMAGAGPLASLLLGLAFWGVTALVVGLGGAETVAGTVGYLALVNGLLAAFNLVPAFPLDGGRMLRAVLWRLLSNRRTATRASVHLGVALGWVGVGAGVVVTASGSPVAGVWWVIVGLFVRAASRSAWEGVLEEEAAEDEAAKGVGPRPDPPRPDPAIRFAHAHPVRRRGRGYGPRHPVPGGARAPGPPPRGAGGRLGPGP